MNVYPWMKRHKRYLSFRYIFPQVTAGWIGFLRGLLRIRWFFAHSIETLVDDLRTIVEWPFAAIEQLGRWVGLIVVQFVSDLLFGLRVGLRWLSRLPVWTGSALAGVMGIILTILLFLVPALQTRPVAARIGAPPREHVSPVTPPDVEEDEFGTPDAAANPEPFDPFASPVQPVADEVPSVFPPDSSQRFAFEETAPDLHTSVSRLSMPWGWDLSRTIDVHSVATASPHFDSWMDITRSTMMDGWGESRERHEPAPTAFSPYVTRVHAEMTGVSPEWVSPEPTVDAMARVDSRRYPSVVVEKLAPATSPAGRPLQYTLVVTNWGDEVLPSVRVREQVSAIEKVINVEPFANVVGNALVWDVADLRPGEQQRLSIEVHADEPLTLTQNTQVQVISDVGAVSEVRQPRPEPALVEPDPQFPAVAEPAPASPKMILPDFGPEPGDLGEPSPEFANDEPPPPARSYFEEDEPAERLPEEDEPVKAPARPRQPLSDALTMEMETPGAIGQGEQVHTVFVLHNRSDSDLTDVLLKVKLSKELQHRNGRTLELRLDRLKAGETYRTRLTTRALQTGTAHIDSQLSCADHRDRTASRQVRIAPEAARRADAVVRIPCVCPPPPCAYRPLF